MTKRIVGAVRRTAGVGTMAIGVMSAGAATVGLMGPAVTELAAQERPIEFGVDGGLAHIRFDDIDTPGGTIEGTEVTGFSFPNATVRFGFWLGERAALDLAGRVGIQRADTGREDDPVTSMSLDLLPGLVWHFADAGRHRQPYVRAEGGFRFADHSNFDSRTQFQAGLAAGVKVPFASTAFLRLEAGWRRLFDTDEARGLHEFSLGTGILAVIN